MKILPSLLLGALAALASAASAAPVATCLRKRQRM